MNIRTLIALRTYLTHCIQTISSEMDLNPSRQSLYEDFQSVYTRLTKELDVLREEKFSPDTHIRLESLHNPICQEILVRIITTPSTTLPTKLSNLKTRLHELLPGFLAICITLSTIDRHQLQISSSYKRKLYAYEQHARTDIDHALLPTLAASIESLSIHGALNQFTLDTLLATCDRTKHSESPRALASIFVAFKQTTTLWTTEHQSTIAQLPDDHITRIAATLNNIQKTTPQPEINITEAIYLLLIKYPSRTKELDHVFHTLRSTKILSPKILDHIDLYLTKHRDINNASLVELTNVLVQLHRDKQLTDTSLAYYADSQKPMVLYKLNHGQVADEVEREYLQKSSTPAVLHEALKADIKLTGLERQLLQENLHPKHAVDILAKLKKYNSELITPDLRKKILSYTPTHSYPRLSSAIDACIKADILDMEVLQHLLTNDLNNFNQILSEANQQNLSPQLLHFAVLQSNPAYLRVTLQLLSTIPFEPDAQQLILAECLYQIIAAYSIKNVEEFFTYFDVDSNLKTLSDWLLVDRSRVDALIKIKSLLTTPKPSIKGLIEELQGVNQKSTENNKYQELINSLQEIDSKPEAYKKTSKTLNYLDIITQYEPDKNTSDEHFSQTVKALSSLPAYLEMSRNLPIDKDEQKKLHQAIQIHPNPIDLIEKIGLIHPSQVFNDPEQATLLRQVLTKSKVPKDSMLSFLYLHQILESYPHNDPQTTKALQQRILTLLTTIEGDIEQPLETVCVAIMYLAKYRLLNLDSMDIILKNPLEEVLQNVYIFHATHLLKKKLSSEDSATIIKNFHHHNGNKTDLACAIISCCKIKVAKKQRAMLINSLFTAQHPLSLARSYKQLYKRKQYQLWTTQHREMASNSQHPQEISELLYLAKLYKLENYSRTIAELKQPVNVLRITNILKFIFKNSQHLKIILDNADILTQPKIFDLLTQIAKNLDNSFKKLVHQYLSMPGNDESQALTKARDEMVRYYSSHLTTLWEEIGVICEPKQEEISASKIAGLSPAKKISYLLLDTIAKTQQPLKIQRTYQLDEVLSFFPEDMNVFFNITNAHDILTHPRIANLFATYLNKLGRTIEQVKITYKFRAAVNQHSAEQAIAAAKEEITQTYFPSFKQLWEKIADICKLTEEQQDSKGTHRSPIKKIATTLFQATSDPLLQDQQNVHTQSISSSVIASFHGLHAKYAHEITTLTLPIIAQEIWGYVTSYELESSQKSEARRALLELFPQSFSFIPLAEKLSCQQDRSSLQLNLGDAIIDIAKGLMLAWCAATDEKAVREAILTSSPEADVTPDIIAKQIALNKDCFMRAIFLSQSMYSRNNSDAEKSKSKEATEHGVPGCPDGTFSSIINGLTSINKHGEIVQINQDSAGEKLQYLVRKKAIEYLAVLYRQNNSNYILLRDMIAKDGIEPIWEHIEQAVATLLLDEYGSLYPGGLADIRFQQTLQAGIYVSLEPQDWKKLDNMLTDLNQLDAADIILNLENGQLFIQHDHDRQKTLVTALQLSQRLELSDKDSFYKVLITNSNPMEFLQQRHPTLFASKAENKQEFTDPPTNSDSVKKKRKKELGTTLEEKRKKPRTTEGSKSVGDEPTIRTKRKYGEILPNPAQTRGTLFNVAPQPEKPTAPQTAPVAVKKTNATTPTVGGSTQ